jgi:hypothetical protein
VVRFWLETKNRRTKKSAAPVNSDQSTSLVKKVFKEERLPACLPACLPMKIIPT